MLKYDTRSSQVLSLASTKSKPAGDMGRSVVIQIWSVSLVRVSFELYCV